MPVATKPEVVKKELQSLEEDLKVQLVDSIINDFGSAFDESIEEYISQIAKLKGIFSVNIQEIQDELEHMSSCSKDSTKKTSELLTNHIEQIGIILDDNMVQLKNKLQSLQTALEECNNQLDEFHLDDYLEQQNTYMSELQEPLNNWTQFFPTLRQEINALPSRAEKSEKSQKRTFVAAVVSAALSAGVIIIQLVTSFV